MLRTIGEIFLGVKTVKSFNMSSSDDPSAADAAEAAGVPEAAAAAAPTGAVVTEEEKAKNANNVQFPWKLHEVSIGWLTC